MLISDLTHAQKLKIIELSKRWNVPPAFTHYFPGWDLPEGWVQGWVGGEDCAHRTIFVGIDPEGYSCS